jgi:hypothetical protein
MKKIFSIILLMVPLVLSAQSSITIGTGAILTVGAGADVCAGSKTIDGTIMGDGTWCSTLPLPVELTSFTAVPQTPLRGASQSVVLNWQTATEVNNYGFEIEKSPSPTPSQREGANSPLGGKEGGWRTVGFVNGHGNSNSPKNYSFVDSNPPSGKVQYRLKQIDYDGKFEYSDVVEVSIETPAQFKLEQNFPNPFNPETTISYKIQAASKVSLKVYDVLGREVATLVDEYKQAGTYNSKLNTQSLELSSGVYFYTLRAGAFVQTKKLLLTK